MKILLEKLKEYRNMIKESEESDLYNDKVEHFNIRTKAHISRVIENAKKICQAYPEFDCLGLMQRAELHDASKFEEPEYTGYIELSWQKFKKNNGTDARTEETTLHHITNKRNTHHPEATSKDAPSLDPNNRDKSVKCIDASNMSDLDIAEMCADWMAMSQELGEGNCRKWYNGVNNVRWSWTPEQNSLIDKLIKVFEVTPDKIEKDIDDLLKIQKSEPSTKTDDYMKGLTNGLAVAKSVVNGKEPELVESFKYPWIKE